MLGIIFCTSVDGGLLALHAAHPGGLLPQVLDRGERIELLVDKTDHLSSEAFTFTRDSRKLKRKMWWKNTRLMATVFAMLLLIAYVIVCFACSPTFRC